MKLNPFAHVENPSKTTFGTKWVEALEAICGQLNSGNPQVGLFDYLTLMLPRAWYELTNWLFDKTAESNLAKIAFVPALIIAIPLYITQVVTSLVLTIVSTPIIAIAAFFSWAFGGGSGTSPGAEELPTSALTGEHVARHPNGSSPQRLLGARRSNAGEDLEEAEEYKGGAPKTSSMSAAAAAASDYANVDSDNNRRNRCCC